MTLQKDPNSLRSQRRLKTGITESRAVRRAKKRLRIALQGYENIMDWRKRHHCSDSKPVKPGSLKCY